jgi:hypothetical protein
MVNYQQVNQNTTRIRDTVRVSVFNATFKNISAISWQSVLLVMETGGTGENTDLLQITEELGVPHLDILEDYHCSLFIFTWIQ